MLNVATHETSRASERRSLDGVALHSVCNADRTTKDYDFAWEACRQHVVNLLYDYDDLQKAKHKVSCVPIDVRTGQLMARVALHLRLYPQDRVLSASEVFARVMEDTFPKCRS